MGNNRTEHVLTDREAARYTCMSESWFRQSRVTGNPDAPPFLKIGRSVRYLRSDLDIWLERKRRRATIHGDSVTLGELDERSVDMTASYNKNVLDKWLLMLELMGDPTLSPAALRLAFWLLDHLNGRTGRCDPGRQTLIRETGMDRSSIKRAQRELVRRGVFTITVRGGIHGKTNSYVPNWTWRAPQASNTQPARATADPCTGRADGPSPGSSLAPKTVKETVKIEPLKNPGKENQTGLKGATSVPPKPRDVDWNGWVRWLSHATRVT